MKKLLLLFAILSISLNGYSQAASVVYDPTNSAINSAIKVLSEGSNKLQNFVAQAEKLKLATDGLDQLTAIKQIMELTDELACLTSELQFNMSLSQNYNCATFLNFKLMSFNLGYTTDILKKVLISKNIFTMEQGERLNVLENIRRTLEKTIEELTAINSAFRQVNQKKLIMSYTKRQYHQPRSLGFNRYNQ